MIEKLQAMALVARFENQPYWSLLTDVAIEELAKAFQSAETLEQAKSAADWLLEYGEERLTTQQIYGRLRDTPVETTVKRDRQCQTCRGSGYANSWHLQVESPRGERTMRAIRCHTCTERGGECQRLVVGDERPVEIRGLFYCEARTKQLKLPLDLGGGNTGIAFYDSAAPCGDCDFGRQRGLAYASRDAEQAEKLAKRRT